MKGKKFKSQKGQSFVEYALILVAVLIFGALLLLLLRETGPAIADTVRCVMHFAVSTEQYTPLRPEVPPATEMDQCVEYITNAIGGGGD